MFLVVNEETIKKYKSDLADEVEPTITELIERAEQGLVALEKKEALLKAKVRFKWTRVPSTTDFPLFLAGGCQEQAGSSTGRGDNYAEDGGSPVAATNKAERTFGG